MAPLLLGLFGFTDLGAQGLTGADTGSAAWGDYDNDGDLDVLLAGDTGSVRSARVYRNDGNAFVDINAGLPGVTQSDAAWGDYDNDGDLDILLTGYTGIGAIARVYRNDGSGAFTDVNAGLVGVSYSAVAWGDYDNDGDLDILLTGDDTNWQRTTRLYRNDDGTFVEVNAGLPGVFLSAVAWGDCDNDGDLDLLLSGESSSGNIARLYRNDGGNFVDANAGLLGVSEGVLAWGDYDADGDLDILLTGYNASAGRSARVYRNDGGGTFVDIDAGLTGVDGGWAGWGDGDNDGDLDILLVGYDPDWERIALVYSNEGSGVFQAADAGLAGLSDASAAWGDYDADGDLDILLTGDMGSGRVAHVYRNDCATANSAPTAPNGLQASVDGSLVKLSWTAASDAETAANGLSYNLRVGMASGASNVLAPMAAASGWRRLPQLGNAGPGTTATLTLPPGTYYWSVQAIDAAWAGGAFAAEGSFGLGVADPGACNSDLVIQNLGATSALARVTLTTANSGGTAWETYLDPLAPRAARPLLAGQLGGAAAGAWAGAADVAASQPVVAIVNAYWDNAATGDRAAATYAGIDVPAATGYLPYLSTAPGQQTRLTVQNAEATQASVTIRFYDRTGTLAGSKTITVPAASEKTLNLDEVPEADFPATGGLGSAAIAADHAIAAVASVHWPHASDAYAGIASGAAVLRAPGAVRKLNADGRYDWSELVVQNFGDAAAAVHVEFIRHDGALSHSLDGTVPAHGAASYSTHDLTALGDDWLGTVKVTSTGGQPLAGVSVAWTPSTGVTDSLAYNASRVATAGALAFPAVYRQLAGAADDQWSLVLVHNAAATSGTLSVEFYDASGARVGSAYTVNVAAGGLARLSLRDGLDLPQAALTALGTGFTGSLWVTPSSGLQLAGVAETFWPEERRAAGYAGFAAPATP